MNNTKRQGLSKPLDLSLNIMHRNVLFCKCTRIFLLSIFILMTTGPKPGSDAAAHASADVAAFAITNAAAITSADVGAIACAHASAHANTDTGPHPSTHSGTFHASNTSAHARALTCADTRAFARALAAAYAVAYKYPDSPANASPDTGSNADSFP